MIWPCHAVQEIAAHIPQTASTALIPVQWKSPLRWPSPCRPCKPYYLWSDVENVSCSDQLTSTLRAGSPTTALSVQPFSLSPLPAPVQTLVCVQHPDPDALVWRPSTVKITFAGGNICNLSHTRYSAERQVQLSPGGNGIASGVLQYAAPDEYSIQVHWIWLSNPFQHHTGEDNVKKLCGHAHQRIGAGNALRSGGVGILLDCPVWW